MKDPFIYYNEESSPIPQIITGNTIYTANTPANITLSTPFITYANEGMTDTSADLDVRAMGEYIQRYGMTGTVDLNFYAVGYNILRIIGGMAAYAYY
jgi:hypothetical protein